MKSRYRLLLPFFVVPYYTCIRIGEQITIERTEFLDQWYDICRMNTIDTDSNDLIRRFETGRCCCFFNGFTMSCC